MLEFHLDEPGAFGDSKTGAFAYAEQIIALVNNCFAWVISG